MTQFNRLYRFLFLVLFSGFVLNACDEYDLAETEFIEDETFSGLPIYSEWGYNTFGAYFDRMPFISAGGIVFKTIYQSDTTTMMFIGEKASYKSSDYEYYYDYSSMKMTVSFPNLSITDLSDFLILNDTVIDLIESSCEVQIMYNETSYPTSVINGTIQFKRSQNLYVDGSFREIILSGYFDLQLYINEEPVSITNGRFDLGIDHSNFFNIN